LTRPLRNQRYRTIEYGDGSKELYDHNNDPNEWQNLANDPASAAVGKELGQQLSELHRE